MIILQLFLLLFSFALHLVTLRALFLQRLFIQKLLRTLKQNNIHVSFKPLRFFPRFTPETILAFWKKIFSKHWTHPHKKPGRPHITKEIREYILKLKKENPSWGLRRIRDELKKLFINVSHETISKVLQHFGKTGDLQPTLSWNRFISAHWNSLFACDFLTIDIFGFKCYYCFFIIELKTRKIVRYGITETPDIQFLRNQFSAFEYEYPGSYLIHDNSGELKWFPYDQYNIKDIAIVPYSPNMNAYAERFVRSIRDDCLDYFIIFTYGQLCRIVKGYMELYNSYRPHQGLKGIPNGLPAECSKTGKIKQKPLLFGLHNHYYREAA